ncbi:hypothetical protein AWH62_12605 [Maricaulis sp. W15]|uniref:hypothetical protein n=1 Tax=Maricaulis sp. W15 TaxID=1772333 RepID=UPI000948D161|nr:hypothetical protein [Maricaulis sp. W15]OLF71383.1 hypothetical protein AWH62_12605 [Maricaulis sp. W15]
MMRLFVLIVLLFGWLPAAPSLAQSADNAAVPFEDTQRVIEWVNDRNSVLGQMVVAPARLVAVVQELRPLLETQEDPERLRQAFDEAIERLIRAQERMSEANAGLSEAPVVAGDESQSHRLEASRRSVDLIHRQADDILARGIAELRSTRDSLESANFTLRVLSVDAEIALLEANILQKETMRSNDPTNPGSLANLASEQVLRMNRDLAVMVRSWIVGEGLETTLFQAQIVEQYRDLIMAQQSGIRRIVYEQLNILEQSLVDMPDDERTEWFASFTMLSEFFLAYEETADLLLESAGVIDDFLDVYPDAESEQHRLQIIGQTAQRLNALTLRRNELLVRQDRMASEVAQAMENH